MQEKAMGEETGAEAAGNLERSKKEISADEIKLKDLQHECMSKAQEFEAAQIERNAELEALAAAKKILQEKTGGAAERTYSFVQVAAQSTAKAKAKGSRDRIVSMLQELAKSNAQPSLAQLAEAVRSTMLTENDPFAKVKTMIQEMLEKLLKEAKEEADKKAFCDKEKGEWEAAKADFEQGLEGVQMALQVLRDYYAE